MTTSVRTFCIGGRIDRDHHRIACPVHRRVLRPLGGLTAAEAGVNIRMALGGCQHRQADPVIISTGEVVACICTACLDPLPADWIAMQYERAHRAAFCEHEWIDICTLSDVGRRGACCLCGDRRD